MLVKIHGCFLCGIEIEARFEHMLVRIYAGKQTHKISAMPGQTPGSRPWVPERRLMPHKSSKIIRSAGTTNCAELPQPPFKIKLNLRKEYAH